MLPRAPLDQARAVRAGAGLWRSGGPDWFLAAGPGAADFLQRMLSNDMVGLAVGRGCRAALLTAKGKVRFLLRVTRREDDFLIEAQGDQGPAAHEALDAFLFGEDVTWMPRDDFAVLGLHGPRAADILASVLDDASALGLTRLGWTRARAAGVSADLVRVDRTGDPGFELHLALDHADAVAAALAVESGGTLAVIDRDALDMLRIEAGDPWPGRELDEHTLLSETGLEEAISYTKGCYPGQEIVARIRTYGHVNRKLCGLDLGSAPLPARLSPLMRDGQRAGAITSSTVSPSTGRTLALAWVQKDFLAPGTELACDIGGQLHPARVAALPMYFPVTAGSDRPVA